ncbi:MAG: DNA mismatch repair endonuclease MutL [bacterium]
MAAIRVLPEHIINQIAAGEVVERPASVAKELMENALDAGATQVFVSVANGGKDMISVFDNGAGMNPADARLAVQRHATSKIHDEAGLAAIRTLGFRGEALASIAAVSRFELVTCADEGAGGSRVVVDGGGEPQVGREAFPRGSKVTVRELFFNTPARRKFLRATATEFQHVQTLLTQLALANPEVHFRLSHNQRQIHNLTPTAKLVERCHQLFGEAFAEGVAFVEGREGTMEFEGLLSSPSHSRASRRWQYLFINGRPIRDAGLNHGIYQAYRTLLMKGRHPAFVVKLTLDCSEVDVNVHPAKSEVRLRNPQWAHAVLADRLHRALMDSSRRRAFGTDRAAGPARQKGEFPTSPSAAADGGPGGGQTEMALASGRALATLHEGLSAPTAPGLAQGYAPALPPLGPGPAPDESPPGQPPAHRAPADSGELAENPFGGEGFHFQPLSARAGMERAEAPPLGEAMTLLGQLHATYLLVQRPGKLVLVDQHAAHERILFEQFRNQFYGGHLVTERYLLPLTLELSPQNALLLEQYLPQWNRLGFEIEPFGRDTFVVRQVPGLLSGKDVPALVLEVLDDLALFGKSGRLEEVINDILERVACHAAIRAGMVLGREEMESLVAQLEFLDINLYCPHGRPVWVEFPLRELEKRFKRIL